MQKKKKLKKYVYNIQKHNPHLIWSLERHNNPMAW